MHNGLLSTLQVHRVTIVECGGMMVNSFWTSVITVLVNLDPSRAQRRRVLVSCRHNLSLPFLRHLIEFKATLFSNARRKNVNR